jgi:hypothetical protein
VPDKLISEESRRDRVKEGRCEVCGYTEDDARQLMDHKLCSGYGKAPWSKSCGETAPSANTPNWATGTCSVHDPPHPACHKCNRELGRVQDLLDVRSKALAEAVNAVSMAPGTTPRDTLSRWRALLGWKPLPEED